MIAPAGISQIRKQEQIFPKRSSLSVLPRLSGALTVWLKADKGVKKADGTLAANGDLIALWENQSGNGLHSRQSGADSLKPNLVTNVLNGRPCVRMTDVSRYLIQDRLNGLLGAGFSFFIVARLPDGNPALTTKQLWGASGISPSAQYLGASVTTAGVVTVSVRSTTLVNEIVTTLPDNDTGYFLLSQIATPGATIQSYFGLQKAASADISGLTWSAIAGVQEETPYWGRSNVNGTVASTTASGLPDICEIVIYNRPLSNQEFSHVANYFTQRYGNNLINSGFNLSVTAADLVVSGGSSSPLTVKDTIYNNFSGSTIDHNFQLSATQFVTYTSSNTGIATVDATGYVARQNDGSVTITATSALGVTRTITLNMLRTAGGSTNVFSDYVAGSAAKNAKTSVDTLLGSLTSSAMLLFSTQDHVTPVYVRNIAQWAWPTPAATATVDLTCISPWNSLYAGLRAGTLITPRHIIFAKHFPLNAGETIRFITKANAVVTATIAATAWVDSTTDLMIASLTADVAATITPCKVLPSTWRNYFYGAANLGGRIPVICTDQEEKGLVHDLNVIPNGSEAQFIKPVDAERLVFYEDLITGDSGNPAFIILNGVLVLICCWHGGGGGTGPHVGDNIAPINAAINVLNPSAGYALSQFDLEGAGFPTF